MRSENERRRRRHHDPHYQHRRRAVPQNNNNPVEEEEEKKIIEEKKDDPEEEEKALLPLLQRLPSQQELCDWDESIVGQKDAKHAIEHAFFLPRKFPSFFKNHANDDRKAVELNRTFLLWGPPGTGKTLLASSIADNHGAKFVKISPADILHCHVGVTELKIKELFETAKCGKTVILLDEIDSYGRKRREDEQDWVRSKKTQLLQSIEDFEKNMMADSALIACTNHFDEIDPALKRRFKTHIFCGLPSHEERVQLFRMFCSHISNFLTDDDYDVLAEQTYLYSGSDICTVVERAKEEPARELQCAEYFLQNDEGKWLPATAVHHQAQRLKLKDLEHDSLAPKRPLEIGDILAALKRRSPTTSQKEYDEYLKHLKKNNAEITKEIKKTKYEQDIDVVFEAHTAEEMDMGYGRVFKQFERYSQKVTDPTSKFMINIQSTQIGLIVLMVLILMIYPMIWWVVLWLLSLFMMTNHVLLPIFMFTWQQFIKNDESNEVIQKNMISQMVGLIVLVFLFSRGTTFFVYSYPFMDICIEWLFLDLVVNYLSICVNFVVLHCQYERLSVSTPANAIAGKVMTMISGSGARPKVVPLNATGYEQYEYGQKLLGNMQSHAKLL